MTDLDHSFSSQFGIYSTMVNFRHLLVLTRKEKLLKNITYDYTSKLVFISSISFGISA